MLTSSAAPGFLDSAWADGLRSRALAAMMQEIE